MRLEIRKFGAVVSRLSVNSGTSIEYGDDQSGFKSWLESQLQQGITRHKIISDGDIRLLVEGPADPQDPNFPLILKTWLERQGYSVEEIRPELDLELNKILDSIADKQRRNTIIELWGDATYLEKTYLLEKLRGQREKND